MLLLQGKFLLYIDSLKLANYFFGQFLINQEKTITVQISNELGLENHLFFYSKGNTTFYFLILKLNNQKKQQNVILFESE